MNHIYINKTSKSKWKIHMVKFLLILLLCIHVYSIFSETLSFIRNLYEGKVITQTKIIFLFIVVSVCLSMLWRVQKGNYILFILGQLLIIIAMCNAYSFSNSALIFFQLTGIVLFFISSVRIFVFLFRGKGERFIEDILSRR